MPNNLLKPKAGAIFATAFPQFITSTDSRARLALMMAAHKVVLVTWLNIYGFVISRAGRALTVRFRHAMERVNGVVLVGLGVRLAFERD